MDTLTIIVLIGGGLLLLKGLSGSLSSPSGQTLRQNKQQLAQQADAQIAQGESIVQATGGYGEQVAQQQQQQYVLRKGGAISAGGAAAGAGVIAGIHSGVLLGGVTFGIGALVGLAAVLWGKHEARIKGAKSENQGWNVIVAGFQESLRGIIGALNAGQIDSLTAVNELKDLKLRIWNSAQQFNRQPGVDFAGGKSQPGLGDIQQTWTIKCDKHCTIGCCLFNNWLGPGINNVIAMIQGRPYWDFGKSSMITGNTITIGGLTNTTKYGRLPIPDLTLTIGSGVAGLMPITPTRPIPLSRNAILTQ